MEDTATITAVVEENKKDPNRLMDIVRAVQEKLGFISDATVDQIAQGLGIHRVQVQDMVSFYTFLKLPFYA